MSFQREDKIYVTDKRILLDNNIAFVDPLPPDGTDKKDEDARGRNYVRLAEYWSRSVRNRFSFGDLSPVENGHFGGPEKLVLGKKYISFLLRRIPEELLHFGMTDGNEDMTRLYRGEKCVGFLMPIRVLPDFSPELIAMAESGHVEAQMQLGRMYSFGCKTYPTDHAESLKWLRRAAEQNHPASFLSLAMAFFFGFGVEPDRTKSLILMERAIELGVKDAIYWRKILIQQMPPEQYKAASAKIVTEMTQDACLG